MEKENEALRKVFEALDSSNKGYISVTQFVAAFENFESSKEMRESFDENNLKKISRKTTQLQNWIEKLDPQKDGKIYFDDFITGIHNLTEDDSNDVDDNHDVTSTFPKPLSFITDEEQFSTEDSGIQISRCDNEDTDSQISRGSSLQSDWIAFNRHETVGKAGAPRLSEASYDDIDFNNSYSSDGLKYKQISKENNNNIATNGHNLKPPPATHQVGLTRGGEIRSTWPKRHGYSPGYLTKSPGVPNGDDLLSAHEGSVRGSVTSLNESTHGMLIDDLDSSFTQLQEQYNRLEEKFDNLNSNQSEDYQREARLKDENNVLVQRLLALEENFREFQDYKEESFEEERRQLKDKLIRLKRDNNEEFERLKNRLLSRETECADSKSDVARLQAEAERFKLEFLRVQNKASDFAAKAESLQDTLDEVRQSSKKEIDKARQERDYTNKLLDDLNKEINDLRAICYKKSSTGEESLASQFREAEELVTRISKENRLLREQLEDSQAELLTRSLEEGRSLVKHSEISLASELDDYSKEEVMGLLVKEKEANFMMRDYIEGIITRVIEQYPSLLEIR